MKLVIAIIKPFELAEVRQALTELGLRGITVTEVRACGAPEDGERSFQPEMKLEMAIEDPMLEPVTEALAAVCTDRTGAGTIHILPLGQAARIRTGERGNAAL